MRSRCAGVGSSGGALRLLRRFFFYNLFYPSIQNQPGLNKLLESYPKELTALIGHVGDITSPEGFLRAEVFSFLLPLLLLIFAIGFGARSIAGEEEEKTLDLVLATPISRLQLVVAQAS